MIKISEEKLTSLLEEAFTMGALQGLLQSKSHVNTQRFQDLRERAIQPLVHRSSEGQVVPKMILPTPEQVMHVVMKFQWEDRKNGTGTTNWAANLGMTVVEYVARLNSDHGREVE